MHKIKVTDFILKNVNEYFFPFSKKNKEVIQMRKKRGVGIIPCFGRSLLFSMALVMLAAVFVTSLWGQSIQTGKVTGRVFLASGDLLPNVAIEISGPRLMAGKRSTFSSDNGTFVFLEIPPGNYTVSASLDGFKTAVYRDVIVSAAAVTSMNVLMEMGEISEEILVVGSVAVVDLKTSAIDTRIDQEMLSKLPTSRDTFYDLSLTAPGMFSVGKDSSWLPSPTAYGGATNENVFLVNGVDTTNPRGASWGSRVNVNYNAVEEVRVVSLGSKAEYGSFSGVAIDVLTKSGSNRFQGTVGFYSKIGNVKNNVPTGTNPNLGADWLYIAEGDELFTEPKKDEEFNLTLGGPLIKNKLWFFAGFNYIGRSILEPNYETKQDYRGRYGDLKLTFEPFRNSRAWVAYHYENNLNNGTSWGKINWDPDVHYNTKSINNTVSGQFQWFPTDRTILSAKYLGFWTDDTPGLPSGHKNHPAYINWWKIVVPNMGVNGAFPYLEAQETSRQTVQGDVSHYAENFLGEHDIKFGVQYTKGRGDWVGGYFFGYANFAYPLGWWPYSVAGSREAGSWYGASISGVGFYNRQTHRKPYLTARAADSLGFFIDDQWTPTNRLTVNLGLRFDRQTAKYDKGIIYDQPLDADGKADPSMIGKLGVARYRSGSDNVFDFNNLAPRFGMTYQLTSDAKTALKLNYGRYFAPITIENLDRVGPDNEPVYQYRYFYDLPVHLVDLDGNGIIGYEDNLAAMRILHGYAPVHVNEQIIQPAYNLNVQDGMKNQHTDQLTIGIERELFRNFSVSATYINRQTKNIIVRFPLNGVTLQEWEYERVPYTTNSGEQVELWGVKWLDYNGDGVIDGNDVAWVDQNMDFEWRNLGAINGVKPRRLYQGLQLVFNKRYSDRWQMLGTFRFTSRDGLDARPKRQDYNIEGANIMNTPWLGGLNNTINNMSGPLPFTPKFEFKLSGSYLVPAIEVDLGFRFRLTSGRALWPLENVPRRASWGGAANSIITTGSEDVRIVSINPKDPLYYPTQKILDLRLERAIKLPKGNLRLVLDLYNALNEKVVTNARWEYGQLGRVDGFLYPGMMARISVAYEF